MKKRNKKAQVAQFQFIASHPTAMLIAGGILFLLIGDTKTGWILIGIGVALQVFWLRGALF